MQFSTKTFFALAIFLPLVSAAALTERTDEECKPILQSCAVDSDCCADLCVAGVRNSNYQTSLSIRSADLPLLDVALPLSPCGPDTHPY